MGVITYLGFIDKLIGIGSKTGRPLECKAVLTEYALKQPRRFIAFINLMVWKQPSHPSVLVRSYFADVTCPYPVLGTVKIWS